MSLDQLQGDTTQNNPNMLPPFAERRGPNLNAPLGIASVGGLQPVLSASPEFNLLNRPILNRPAPMPVRPPIFGGFQPVMPDYSGQFEKLGEQLGGFSKQLDALGSFNEQVGGLGKQFEAVNNKLDSLEKGLGSLGNQLASIEQGQPKPQEVQQPQRRSFSPFGLANLFMNLRRF